MPCFIVAGHRGAGKTLFAIHKAREYLNAGRRVASNVTLKLDRLMGARNRSTWTKLPGIPRREDFDLLGKGYEGDYNEKKAGLLILDEASIWMNSQSWNEKGRAELKAWLMLSRKLGWDLVILIQDWESLDAQARRSLTDIYVSASCTDRLRIPGTPLKLPKAHFYNSMYKVPGGMPVGRLVIRGTDLHKGYDTQELIGPEEHVLPDGEVIDARGSWSGLSAWHLVGRYLPPPPRPSDYLFVALKWLIAWPVAAMGDLRSKEPTRRPDTLRHDLGRIFPVQFPHHAMEVHRYDQRACSKPRPVGRDLGYSLQTRNLAAMVIAKRRAAALA